MASMTCRHAATALVVVALVASCVAADDKPRLPARVRPVAAQSRVQPLRAELRTPLIADATTATADALEQGRKHAPPSADAKPPFNWSRLIISYLLWSLLPLSGAHHLYLGRNRAALLSSVTCGGFVVGHVLDVLRMPGYVRRLAEAEREEGIEAAAAVAGAGSRARAAASRAAAAAAAKRPGKVGGFFSLLVRCVVQLVLGAWVGLHFSRVLPDAAAEASRSWLRAAGAAVAVWLASASAGGGLRPGPLAAAVGGVHALASGPLAPWLATHLPQMQPGSPALVAAVALANAPASLHERLGVAGARWKRLARPRRSWRSAVGVILASTAFWMLVLASTLLRQSVRVTADGAEQQVNALWLLRCSLCVLRPKAMLTAMRELREPLCWKETLGERLGSFERLCVHFGEDFMQCFDWDVSGTRWARSGFSMPAAYDELGVKASASMAQVKAAYRAKVLTDHPDKVTAPRGSPEWEAANARFMKATRAYETIAVGKKKKPPPTPTAATSAKPTRASAARARSGSRRK